MFSRLLKDNFKRLNPLKNPIYPWPNPFFQINKAIQNGSAPRFIREYFLNSLNNLPPLASICSGIFLTPIHRNFSQQTAQVFHVKNGIIRKVIVSDVAQLG